MARKRSRKEKRAIHAKKRKDFDIWAHQTRGESKERKGKGASVDWADRTEETKKKHSGKRNAFLPEF
jgi:hypothetical protein